MTRKIKVSALALSVALVFVAGATSVLADNQIDSQIRSVNANNRNLPATSINRIIDDHGELPETAHESESSDADESIGPL